MTPSSSNPGRVERPESQLSLYHLPNPEMLANPNPRFHRLRALAAAALRPQQAREAGALWQ
jgi:hypothetical protein